MSQQDVYLVEELEKNKIEDSFCLYKSFKFILKLFFIA